eukprot:NODE_212_length_12593_cov_0.662638.p4 type:complete len:405 gc:universal NODE_212_length_12593_cov_0.662638:8545-9759(+)
MRLLIPSFQTMSAIPRLPAQFASATTSCGIRSHLDLALIWSNQPCSSAGVFTKNAFKAAPVLICQDLLKKQTAQGVVINAGNANAVTGKKGFENATKMSAQFVKPVFVMSTGVIGKQLPIEKVINGMSQLNNNISSDEDSVQNLAQAIMTTDTRPKYKTLEFKTKNGKVCTITGIAKGAGMIHPNMATMLGCILTDAKISQSELQQLLSKACFSTFNSISVDGDTSTNDTVLALANHQVELDKNEMLSFENNFQKICSYLSDEIVRDGEGATKLIELTVKGLNSNEDAFQVARFVSRSPLVKTAMFGRDANWGRLFSSAGSSHILQNETFNDTSRMSCKFSSKNGTIKVFEEEPLNFNEDLAKNILDAELIQIEMVLGDGPGKATSKTCDFTPDYVHVNASYRS